MLRYVNSCFVTLSFHQRDCLHFAIVAKPSERFMPEDPNTWQYRVWKIVDSRPFEYFIMLLIALNTLILTMKVGEPML